MFLVNARHFEQIYNTFFARHTLGHWQQTHHDFNMCFFFYHVNPTSFNHVSRWGTVASTLQQAEFLLFIFAWHFLETPRNASEGIPAASADTGEYGHALIWESVSGPK